MEHISTPAGKKLTGDDQWWCELIYTFVRCESMGMAKRQDDAANKGTSGEKKFDKHDKKPERREKARSVKGIVRLGNIDIDGGLPVMRAIWQVKGIGPTLASVLGDIICQTLGIDPKMQLGDLTEVQIEQIIEILSNPAKYGVPAYFLNRQRERDSGEAHHLIGNDLVFATHQDIEYEKESFTWKGFRHAYGQKVRGQHTRTTGRKGMAVGVLRKGLIKPVEAPAGAPGAPVAPGAAGAAAPKGPTVKAGASLAAGAKPEAKKDAKPAQK